MKSQLIKSLEQVNTFYLISISFSFSPLCLGLFKYLRLSYIATEPAIWIFALKCDDMACVSNPWKVILVRSSWWTNRQILL